VRLIGVISPEQIQDEERESNDRLLGAAIHSYNPEDIKAIDAIGKTLPAQLEEFCVSYNKQRGKKFRITGAGGRHKAIKFLKTGMKKRN
jgi:inorganic pyrophosphatase